MSPRTDAVDASGELIIEQKGLVRWITFNRPQARNAMTWNMYDRLVHFSFGFFIAYPVREAFLRITKVKGFWGYYLPLDLVLACSAIYNPNHVKSARQENKSHPV